MKRFLYAVIGLGVLAAPASSAERISFQLGEFERSIPIDELANYAAGGLPATALADGQLRLFKPSEKLALRKALKQSVPVNAVMASNYLSTAVGKRTIQQLVNLINQPTDVAGNALASALIEGAANGDGLRLIDVLQAYPLPSIPVNVSAVGSLLRSLTQEFNLQNKLYARLTALGEPSRNRYFGFNFRSQRNRERSVLSRSFVQLPKGRLSSTASKPDSFICPRHQRINEPSAFGGACPWILNTDMNRRLRTFYDGADPGQSWLCGCVSGFSLHQR